MAHAPQSDVQAHLTSGHRVKVVDLLGKQWPYLSGQAVTEVAACRARWSTKQHAAKQLKGTPLKWHERHREETKMSKNHFTCGGLGKFRVPRWMFNTIQHCYLSAGFHREDLKGGTPTSAMLGKQRKSSTLQPPHPIPINWSIDVHWDHPWPAVWEILGTLATLVSRSFRRFFNWAEASSTRWSQDTTRSILEASGKRKNLGFWWMLIKHPLLCFPILAQFLRCPMGFLDHPRPPYDQFRGRNRNLLVVDQKNLLLCLTGTLGITGPPKFQNIIGHHFFQFRLVIVI